MSKAITKHLPTHSRWDSLRSVEGDRSMKYETLWNLIMKAASQLLPSITEVLLQLMSSVLGTQTRIQIRVDWEAFTEEKGLC